MPDSNNAWFLGVGSAVIFGAGFISAHVLRKLLFRFTGSSPTDSYETIKKTTRLMAARAGLERNHKMVFVVRTDLNMGKGKIAAQCCHAAIMCYQKAKIMDPVNLDLWEATGTAKVCLKANGDFESLKSLQRKAKDLKLVTAIVCDAGHTQVDPGTYTVLGIGPAPISEIDQVTGHLKLL